MPEPRWTFPSADFNEAVEKAAVAMSARVWPGRPWDDFAPEDQERYREDAMLMVGIAFPILCGPYGAENRRLREQVERLGGSAGDPDITSDALAMMAENRTLRQQVEMLKAGFRCVEPCSCLTHCPAHEGQDECDPPCCYAAAVRQRDEAQDREAQLVAEIEDDLGPAVSAVDEMKRRAREWKPEDGPYPLSTWQQDLLFGVRDV